MAGHDLAAVAVAPEVRTRRTAPEPCARRALEELADGSFAEYFEPFTGEPLGSDYQSWTAAVVLDWLVRGDER